MPEVVVTAAVKQQQPVQITNLAKALQAKVAGPVVAVVNKPNDISSIRDLSKPTRVNVPATLVGTTGMISVKQETDQTISGKVIDEKGESVPFASIELLKAGQFIIADENGKFTVKKNRVKKGGILLVSSAGFESKTIIAGEENFISGQFYVQLKANVVLPEVVLTAPVTIVGRIRIGIVTKVTKGEMFLKKADTTYSKAEKKIFGIEDKLLVYPNPVQSGAALNVSFKKMDEGYYTINLLNQSGQSVHQQEIWIDTEARLLNIDVPVVAAGSYFLSLADKNSGKKFTEKIIVQ
jgi:hypothetical protein